MQDRPVRSNLGTRSGHFQPLPFALCGAQKIACSERCSLSPSLCRALLSSQRQWPSWARHKRLSHPHLVIWGTSRLSQALSLSWGTSAGRGWGGEGGIGYLSREWPDFFSPFWSNAHAHFPLDCFCLRSSSSTQGWLVAAIFWDCLSLAF